MGDSSARAPTVLIVDDLPLNVMLLSHFLEAEGFRTTSASSATEALAASRQHQPDIILLDVGMPVQSGFELCSRLKSDSRTADIPVVFLSALDDSVSKVRGLESGGVGFISKPVHPEDVLAAVRLHLHLAEKNRAIARQLA
jgi:DNA-binding response OmpR family regulator